MRMLFALAVAMLVAGGAIAMERRVALKDGPGRETVENLCSGCHSVDYIRINAPFMSRQTWTAEVDKMRRAFGAPIGDADANRIVDYLSSNYGAPA